MKKKNNEWLTALILGEEDNLTVSAVLKFSDYCTNSYRYIWNMSESILAVVFSVFISKLLTQWTKI